MFGLERKLSGWVEQGLLTDAQARKISEFEHGRHRPVGIFAVAALAALSIAVGLVSIVAANWAMIPGHLKLAVDLALVTALGWGILHWERGGPPWAREAGIVVLYGLVMASIALIGQVYQLGGEAHEAMGIWTLLTALLMTRARSTAVATIWMVGVHTTAAVWVFWAADGPWQLKEHVIGVLYWLPTGTLLAGRHPWVRTHRPAFARAFTAMGWRELWVVTSLATLAWYENTAAEDWRGMWLTLPISAALTAWLVKQTACTWERGLLILCLVLSHLPWPVSSGDLGVVAATTFVALWAVVAKMALAQARSGLFSFATACIGVRIIVIYFEVFSDLLNTGVILLVGGLLTLGIMTLWLRWRRRFESRQKDGAIP